MIENVLITVTLNVLITVIIKVYRFLFNKTERKQNQLISKLSTN